MREEKHIDVSGGNVQIGTNGSHQYQYNFYGAEFAERINAAMAVQNGAPVVLQVEQSQAAERAERDMDTIFHLMRHLNVPMMDAYLDRSPARVRDTIFDMHDAWKAIFRSSTFIIYDETMDRLVRDFYQAWHEVVVKGLPYYEPSDTPGDRVFGRAEFDLFDSPGQEECFRELLSQWEPLTRKFKAMMECINHKYVIDWKDVTIK